MNKTNSHYSEYALNRKQAPIGQKLSKVWHKSMLRNAEKLSGPVKGKRIVEIGVGHGHFAEISTMAGALYSGVEMNEILAQELRNSGHQIFTSRLPPLPIEIHNPQIVWLSHVLEHAENYMVAREILADIYQRLEPGGILVVICPDYLSWKGEFWNGDWSHGFPTTLRRCKQILNDVGFQKTICRHAIGTSVCTPVVFVLHQLFKLIPYRLFDFVFSPILKGKTFAYSFMTLFGWRNVFIIAEKE